MDQTGNRLFEPETKVAMPAGMKIIRTPSISSSMTPHFLSIWAWARAIGNLELVAQPRSLAPASGSEDLRSG
jgi:hypothetical protein